jgi:hypothetical protein
MRRLLLVVIRQLGTRLLGATSKEAATSSRGMEAGTRGDEEC